MTSIDQLHQPFDRHFREEPDYLHVVDPRVPNGLAEATGGFVDGVDLGFREGDSDLPVVTTLQEDNQPTMEQKVILTEAKGRSEHREPTLMITDPNTIAKIGHGIESICTAAESAARGHDAGISFSEHLVSAEDPHEEARAYQGIPGGGVFHVHRPGNEGAKVRVTWQEANGRNIVITSISAPEDAKGKIDFSEGATILREEFLADGTGGGVDFTMMHVDRDTITVDHKSTIADPRHHDGMTEEQAIALIENAQHAIEPKKEGLIARNRVKLGYSALYAATLAAYLTH